MADLGRTFSELELKTGIQELNSGIHFDVGGNLNLAHPMMNIWQGVWFNGKHVTSMDRSTDTPIPEFEVWTMRKEWQPGTKEIRKVKDTCIRWGWRNLFEDLHNARIPGVTRLTLCNKFKVSVKHKQYNDSDHFVRMEQKPMTQGNIVLASR